MPKLSKTEVEKARPSEKERFIWDDELKGFGLKIFPSGTKTFVIQYRTAEGRSRRFTIGKYCNALTSDQARRIAKDKLADVTKGADPQGERTKRREAWTVNELLDAYLKSPSFAKKADTTRKVDEGRINRHVRPTLGTSYADKLTPDDVKRAHREVAAGKTAVRVKTRPRGVAKVKGGNGTADKAVLILRAAYTWAIDEGLLQDNPAARVKVSQPGERSTIVDSAEDYARLFRTLETMENEKRIRSAAADAIRLIALTGARRGEVINLRWAWVDLKNRRITLPPKAHKAGHKTGRVRVIGLPAAAQEIIARQPAGEPDDYVFQASKGDGPIALARPWQDARSEANLPSDLGLHGLRHSVGSHMAMAGASINEIMEVLGHRQTSTALRYIHFAEQARSTLAERAASVALAGLKGTEESAEVIPLNKGNTAA